MRGACTVLTNKIPSFEIWAGYPAHPIGDVAKRP